jgi:hypothetical protein
LLDEQQQKIVDEVINDKELLDIKMTQVAYFSILGILINLYETNPSEKFKAEIEAFMDNNKEHPKLKELIGMVEKDLEL